MKIECYYGKDIEKKVYDLARLRIAVFQDFPYLYEGNLEYEKNYLKIYTNSQRSILVAAFDGDLLIGAATALPLVDEADYVQEPFIKAGMNLNDIYYFGESVLLEHYRGQGIGHQFFDEREKNASRHGFKFTCFCGVYRPESHPSRPSDLRALDEFWIKRGYAKQSHLTSQFSWQDIGDKDESFKTMIYWMKKC